MEGRPDSFLGLNAERKGRTRVDERGRTKRRRIQPGHREQVSKSGESAASRAQAGSQGTVRADTWLFLRGQRGNTEHCNRESVLSHKTASLVLRFIFLFSGRLAVAESEE